MPSKYDRKQAESYKHTDGEDDVLIFYRDNNATKSNDAGDNEDEDSNSNNGNQVNASMCIVCLF